MPRGQGHPLHPLRGGHQQIRCHGGGPHSRDESGAPPRGCGAGLPRPPFSHSAQWWIPASARRPCAGAAPGAGRAGRQRGARMTRSSRPRRGLGKSAAKRVPWGRFAQPPRAEAASSTRFACGIARVASKPAGSPPKTRSPAQGRLCPQVSCTPKDACPHPGTGPAFSLPTRGKAPGAGGRLAMHVHQRLLDSLAPHPRVHRARRIPSLSPPPAAAQPLS